MQSIILQDLLDAINRQSKEIEELKAFITDVASSTIMDITRNKKDAVIHMNSTNTSIANLVSKCDRIERELDLMRKNQGRVIYVCNLEEEQDF